MSNLTIVRSFEGVVAIGFVATLIWIWRQRNPLYLGTFLAGGLCFVFDWSWCSRSFFNATFNPALIHLPGVTTQGVFYPLLLPPAWALAFGLTTILLLRAAPWFDRRLGGFGYVAIWLIGGIGMTAGENLMVGLLHIYTYHQKPEYLIGTVPWANVLLSGNLQLLCYVFLRGMQKWAALPARAGFAPGRDTTWKGLTMGALPVWGGFVIAYVIELFWYGASNPWIESGRPF